MGMTGELVIVVCPICGESYDSPESVRDLLRNWGFCVNITCLTDLSRLPLQAALARERGERKAPSH